MENQAGYLKTYFRTNSAANHYINMEVLNVDYSQDFMGDLSHEDSSFWLNYLLMRGEQLLRTIIDLSLCYLCIYVSSWLISKIIFKFSQESHFSINAGKMGVISIVVMIVRWLPYCLCTTQYPYSTCIIAYTNLVAYNFGNYVLMHSKYKAKYTFWMSMGTILYYFYLMTYPYSNVTLCNTVFITFSLYQIFHNLFKFSY